MRTDRSRRDGERDVPDKQIHRWTDDGGALPPPATEVVAPVMWSPSALNARLEAEHALQGLPRTCGPAVEARALIRRVITLVERRELSLRAATERFRALTARLDQHRLVEDARRGPRAWQLLSHGRRTDHAY